MLTVQAATGTKDAPVNSIASQFDEKAVDAVLAAAGLASRVPTRRAASIELSEREIEVLRLIARGLSSKEMAARLVISPKTAGHHVQHIYSKIGVSTRAGATLFALQNNLSTRNALFTVYAPPGIEPLALHKHLEDIPTCVRLIAPQARTELLAIYSAE
jgi:DNA-binding CsgD family transcriptional regulator